VGTGHLAGDDSLARHFFAAQDLTEVLERWGRWLPEQRVHVVVGAPEGARPEVLWSHFADVVGFDPDGFPPAESRRTNASLGVDEIDLLRRVNVALDGRLRQPAYGRLAKHRLAHELLAGQGSARPVLPGPLHDAVTGVAERWCKEVRKAGYTVHGDLDDLLPVRTDGEGTHPDATSATAQREVAAAVIAELLLDLEEAQDARAHQEEKRRSWKKQAKKLKLRLAELG
jgi:hypothetical protein